MKHLHQLHQDYPILFQQGFVFVKGNKRINLKGFNVVRVYGKHLTINGKIKVTTLRHASEYHGGSSVYVFEPQSDIDLAKGERLFTNYRAYEHKGVADGFLWYLEECGFRAVKSFGVQLQKARIEVHKS